MNSNTSEESLITSTMEPSSIPSSSIPLENPLPNASVLEPTMPSQNLSTMMPIGESESNPILMPIENRSSPSNAIPSVKPLLSLKSQVTAKELLESRPPEPKVLKVSKEDIQALCQMINEFKDQFVGIY